MTTNQIFCMSPHYLKSVNTQGIHIGEICIKPNEMVKNLGVIFDQCLRMEDHVTAVCRAGYFHLKNIRSLKPYLTHKALLTVTHAFITSRIDYCNSLRYGVSDCSINRLKKFHNCAARNLHLSPVTCHISHPVQNIANHI